ncbi:MAG: L-threonylcarbamoyladenylate synthase [Candidatus Planktophila sp.]|nr:L-threonylcarbamoyladenylate synthase [Candidatus Planktophila sp.]
MNQSQYVSNCTADALRGAAGNILAGNLVAFPTETVYGLGADACNADAVARLYSVKGRPSDHPLIVHVSSMQSLEDWAKEIPVYAISLARDFWPGPMTLVLKRSALAEDFITGGQETVGIRVPDHVVALALLEAFESIGGKGIAAPSANRFGQVSPTTAAAVAEEIGEFLDSADQIIDGGACIVGVESTIIDCTSDAPRILRPGAITVEMIEQSTGLDVLEVGRNAIRVSGSLENHYAPAAKVILDVAPIEGQGFIALAEVETPAGVIRLAAPKSDREFAQVLYAALRRADADGLSDVVVHQPTGDGIAVAIRDRLARAANGR